MNFTDDTCPECGADQKEELKRGEDRDSFGRFPVLYRCTLCDTAWDSYVA